MAQGRPSLPGAENAPTVRSKRRSLLEIAIPYGLILLVAWTPRPWQKPLWLIAAASVVTITCISFDGLKAMGMRRENFFRSLWVVAAAMLFAAVAVLVAIALHTLHTPQLPASGRPQSDNLLAGPIFFAENFCAYALWACVQQFLLQCFFLLKLLRLLQARYAAATAAIIFAAAHLPNPILTSITLVWGFAACLLFLRYRNIYPLAIAHAILGISIAITIPGPVIHNMRVGLGYLTYHAHKPALSSAP